MHVSIFVVLSIYACMTFHLLGQNNRDASSLIQWKNAASSNSFAGNGCGLKNVARDSVRFALIELYKRTTKGVL